jgi:signal transduction histidine kinase
MKNPTSAIMGLSELLAKKATLLNLPDIQNYANAINTSIKSLYSLMENLLEWAMLQRNELKYTPSQVEIDSLVNECIKIYQNNLIEKNIKIRYHSPHQLTAFCDSNMIKTVIRNLLSNSIKFTNNGGNITIETGHLDEKFVIINITDTGIGIEKHIIEKLFKIEDKFSNKGTNDEVGTGLGLVLCKELIEKNHGNISVKSEIGKGSTFHISLPKNITP